MTLEQELDSINAKAGGLKGDHSDWARSRIKFLSRQRRAARLRYAQMKGTHTQADWEAILEKHDYKCAGCGIHASALIGGRLTKDHIIAIADGGSDGADNLQPMCRNCNTEKRFKGK